MTAVRDPKASRKQICPYSSVPVKPDSECYIIDGTGDMVLDFHLPTRNIRFKYRCASGKLRESSPYFRALLDPSKFKEGVEFQERTRELEKQYGITDVQQIDKLPVIIMQDIGNMPPGDGHGHAVIAAFLAILHGKEVDLWEQDRSHAVLILALLSILADQFSAPEIVWRHIQQTLPSRPNLFNVAGKHREMNVRCKLLAGLLLGSAKWFRECSTDIIIRGSHRWQLEESDQDQNEEEEEPALWWRLPDGLEGQISTIRNALYERADLQAEELQCRHEYVLETIASIQTHFLRLYASKDMQCKMFYDNSRQCDSFQLGEMVRFLSRKGLLELGGGDSAGVLKAQPVEDINTFIAKLKECPSYQIDVHHTRCGLRTRMLEILDRLVPSGQVGICLSCWRKGDEQENWARNPSGGRWSFSRTLPVFWGVCSEHQALKAMYTAEERDWTPHAS